MSKFIWANHNELINLEAVSMVRLLAGDNVAHAFFPGSDKPVMMNGQAALSLLESMARMRPPKHNEEQLNYVWEISSHLITGWPLSVEHHRHRGNKLPHLRRRCQRPPTSVVISNT